MADFFCIVGNESNSFNSEFSNWFQIDGLSIGYDFDEKFSEERFFLETQSYVLLFEGFLFDIACKATGKEYIVDLINRVGFTEALNKFNGVFRGVFFDKNSKKTILFTDHLAAYKIYYSFLNGKLIFGSRLSYLTKYARDLGLLVLDDSAIYGFLGFGYFLDKYTYFKDIHKLTTGQFLEYTYSSQESILKNYYEFKIVKSDCDESELIERFESIFSKSMDRITALNNYYGYRSASALSGGLDAKTVSTFLYERGVTNNLTLTFAQSSSYDATVPEKIASDLGLEHLFYCLDRGNFLALHAREYIKKTEGLLSYQTAIHGYSMLRNIDFKDIGVYASGQIGDVLFGSFLGKKYDTIESLKKLSYCGIAHSEIYEKIDFLEELVVSYQQRGLELFNYEQRQSNATIVGDNFVRQMVDTISPFFNRKLIELSLSIPDSMQLHSNFQIKWLKAHHPIVLKYIWDKCGCCPTSLLKIRISTFVSKALRYVGRRFGKSVGMNPFDLWMRQNPKILDYLNFEYKRGINQLNLPSELKINMEKLYFLDNSTSLFNKFVVVTALLSLSMHMNGDFYSDQ